MPKVYPSHGVWLALVFAAELWGCRASTPGDRLELAGPVVAGETTLASVGGAMIFADRPGPAACAERMVHVAGEYCPNVVQRCLKWMDPPGSRYDDFRCAEYAQPATCASARRHLDYCIDRDEVARDGTSLPTNEQSWTDAAGYCRSVGKRVCLQSEWQFACEGVEMRPYPYGFRRDASACNADRTDIYEAGRARIKDLRASHGSHPGCASPFGVRDLTGNLEEFVTIDGTNPPKPAMMGAWWQPSRNHCRARQTAHDAYYRGRETGFRCCSDADGLQATRSR